jgi:phenylacetate-CoA ligase
MLDTAWRQIRYSAAVFRGGRIRVDDVRHLVRDILATWSEFGPGSREQLQTMRREAVNPEARRELDAQRWAAAVRQAYDRTVYYRDLMDRLGLTPDALTLDRAHELPPTTKAAVRDLPEAFVSSTAEPVLQAWTTGTTGTPTSFWFSRYELELASALGAVTFLVSNEVGPADVVQIAISSRAVLGLYNTLDACRLVGAAAFLTGMVHPTDTLERMATPVHLPGKKPQVSVLSTNPSYLGLLVDTAAREGYRAEDFGLEQILTGGEVLSSSLRARAEAAFGARVVDMYGMTETFPVGSQLCEEGHLHTSADQGLVEVLDPDTYQPAAPGEVGTLVVTPFPPYRETMPVLRLDTGDLVRPLAETPTCEMAALPATSPVLGRAAHATGGPPLHQRDVLDLLDAEPALPLPNRYATEPADDGHDLHVLARCDDPAVVARLESAARGRGLPVRRIVLHTDAATMPRPPQFVRALLHETAVVRDGRSGTWSLH